MFLIYLLQITSTKYFTLQKNTINRNLTQIYSDLLESYNSEIIETLRKFNTDLLEIQSIETSNFMSKRLILVRRVEQIYKLPVKIDSSKFLLDFINDLDEYQLWCLEIILEPVFLLQERIVNKAMEIYNRNEIRSQENLRSYKKNDKECLIS